MFGSCRLATQNFNSLFKATPWPWNPSYEAISSLPGRWACDCCHADILSHPVIFNTLADTKRFSLKISSYMAPFILYTRGAQYVDRDRPVDRKGSVSRSRDIKKMSAYRSSRSKGSQSDDVWTSFTKVTAHAQTSALSGAKLRSCSASHIQLFF